MDPEVLSMVRTHRPKGAAAIMPISLGSNSGCSVTVLLFALVPKMLTA
jgi:hypothetical protein